MCDERNICREGESGADLKIIGELVRRFLKSYSERPAGDLKAGVDGETIQYNLIPCYRCNVISLSNYILICLYNKSY